MQKTCLVITSIASPNAALKAFAAGAKKNTVDFILIGDTKSPEVFSLEGCEYYPVKKQLALSTPLATQLPFRHYSRKNLGYLLAKDYDIIIESDDDNFPKENSKENNFWDFRTCQIDADLIQSSGWINAYSYFTDKHIWPRGFPLEKLTHQNNASGTPASVHSPIQQGLADENPDVDAVYRMTMQLPVSFENRKPVALGKNCWCPFNSQNTIWYKEAYPLLYLPSHCSFRMTDIWRSFIAQRVAWTCDWNITFHPATVWQERNEHDLLNDFKEEIPGYVNNATIKWNKKSDRKFIPLLFIFD
jgi:hypothetical protein